MGAILGDAPQAFMRQTRVISDGDLVGQISGPEVGIAV